ncbi:MAG: DUF2703 domain-containing protein [Candidatus Kerfeldbacteria bacterium]|nr:DUF2703 domain-containing protein [Candidatus Kerfeldbacteria bacterium]
MDNSNSCGCSCSPEKKSNNDKNLAIEFLYLDLSTCGRCQWTDTVIDESIADIKEILGEIGYSLSLTKTHIQDEQSAKNHAFLSSPTIRINGKDIVLQNKESNCSSCGDYCGTEIDCRDWEWNGKTYDSPPKGMIIDAIFRAIYNKDFGQLPNFKDYKIPKNIRKFLEACSEKEEKK